LHCIKLLHELDEMKSVKNDVVTGMPEAAKTLVFWVFITSINNDNDKQIKKTLIKFK
jgi:hypothetical protein